MFGAPWFIRLRQTPLGVAAAALAWLAAVVLVFHRLPFGTSNKDEAYYNAMAYAFAIGNRPYVDELGIFQNAAILLAPFYRAYIAISGSGDGIILFNRYLYFAYSLASSVLAYLTAKRLSDNLTALWVGALVASYAYFNLFAISYNTVGAFGFFCGVLCTANAMLNARPGRMLFVANLLFLTAVFGYPGLLPALLLYQLIVLGWLLRTRREARNSGFKGLAAGAVVILVAFLVLAIEIGGRPGFARLAAFTHAMGYGTQTVGQRMRMIGHLLVVRWRWAPLQALALFAALPLACLLLERNLWLAVLAALAPAVFNRLYAFNAGVFAASCASIAQSALPVLAPLCVALNRRWQHGRLVLALIWLPSVLSMGVLSYTSSNYFYAACLGVLGALVAGVVSFAALIRSLAECRPQGALGRQLVFGSFIVSLFVMQLRSLYENAYSEAGSVELCTARVHSGPSRGLKTSPQLAQFLEAIDGDLKTVAKEHPEARTLTIFDDFPAGYMSTHLKPRTFSNWILWGFFPATYAQAISKETWGRPDRLPDLLLAVHVNPIARSNYWGEYFRRRYRPIVRRPEFDYMILKRIEKAATRG